MFLIIVGTTTENIAPFKPSKGINKKHNRILIKAELKFLFKVGFEFSVIFSINPPEPSMS